MSRASNLRRTLRRRKHKKQRPVRFKVRRGEWRSREETRALLDLPAGSPCPKHICKLPLPVLMAMKTAAALRMQQKLEAAETAPVDSADAAAAESEASAAADR